MSTPSPRNSLECLPLPSPPDQVRMSTPPDQVRMSTPPWDQVRMSTPSPPPDYMQAGSTHPTGMHSCSILCLEVTNKAVSHM